MQKLHLRFASAALTVATTLVCAVGCVASPLSGETLTSPGQAIAFQGYTLLASFPVQVYQSNIWTEAWDPVPGGLGNNNGSAYVDGVGTSWYEWSIPNGVTLIQDPSHWLQIGQNTLVTEIKGSNAEFGDLYSYNGGAQLDNCVAENNAAGGGVSVENNCSQKNANGTPNPSIQLYAPCGGAGQACCLYSPSAPGPVPCQFGMNCTSAGPVTGTCSVACGAVGQAPCVFPWHGGPTCNAGLQPTNNVCVCNMCGGACVDFLNNNANCGSCGHACPTNETCSAGSCACQAPFVLNTSIGCVDPTAVATCGANVSYIGSPCIAPAGVQALCCGGTCAVADSSATCGACGNSCNDGSPQHKCCAPTYTYAAQCLATSTSFDCTCSPNSVCP